MESYIILVRDITRSFYFGGIFGGGGAGVIFLISLANPHSKMSESVNHKTGGRGK